MLWKVVSIENYINRQGYPLSLQEKEEMEKIKSRALS